MERQGERTLIRRTQALEMVDCDLVERKQGVTLPLVVPSSDALERPAFLGRVHLCAKNDLLGYTGLMKRFCFLPAAAVVGPMT
jgi:hypothetical protein